MSLIEFRKLYQDMHSLLLWITSQYNVYHDLKKDMQEAWNAFLKTASIEISLDHLQNVYYDILRRATTFGERADAKTDMHIHLNSLLSYDIDYHLQRCKRICEESETLKTDTQTISRLEQISTQLTHFRNKIEAFILNKNKYFVNRHSGRKRK